jgi:hypothetical protein
MLYNLSDILRDTRIYLNYNGADQPLVSQCDTDTLMLDDLILSKVAMATREVLEASPPWLTGPGIPLCSRRLSWPEGEGRGMAILALPDDFLLLRTIRLSDWHRPARIIREDDPAYAWQSSPFIGVRGNPSRPVAVIVQQPQGWIAELYSSSAGPGVTVMTAQYHPVPKVIGSTIDIPPLLYDAVIHRIGEMTLHTPDCCE